MLKYSSAMCSTTFNRPIYVMNRLMTELESCDEDPNKLSPKKRKFFMLRALELYYRSGKILAGREGDMLRQDMLVLSCFQVMYKLYDAYHVPLEFMAKFVRCLHARVDQANVQEYMKKLEREVEFNVKWQLLPKNMIKEGDDLKFHEAWRFELGHDGGVQSVRPKNFTGPRAESVELHLNVHVYFMDVIESVKAVTDMYDCGKFWLCSTSEVPEELRSMHVNVLEWCKADPLFRQILFSYLTGSDGVCIHPLYADAENLSPDHRPLEALKEIQSGIVSGLCEIKSQQLIVLREHAMEARSIVLAGKDDGVSEEAFQQVQDKVKTISKGHHMYKVLIEHLQVVHYGSARTCRHLLKSIEDVTTETLEKLKLSASAKRKREARMLPPSAPASAVRYTRTKLVRQTYIMTRVGANPFETPARNVRHKVTVLLAPTKVVKETFETVPGGGGRSKLVKVDVSPNFFKACETSAAAYVAKNVASEAAEMAAEAADAEMRASDAEAAAAAAAAMDAAAFACTTANVAAAAAAAAAFVLSELEKEVDAAILP